MLPALLLVACATPVGSGPKGPPSQATSRPGAARPATPATAPPYQGPPGTCAMEGLEIPLYSGRDPRWGKPSAPVALVVFSDFECPYCAKYRHSLEAVKQRFRPEQVQILWKNTPLRMHPNARPAAEASQAVFEARGAEAFWRYHDLVFANRKAISAEGLALWAAEVGLPEDAWKRALAAPSVPGKVDEDLALARAIGLQGTPMTVLNGLPIEGAQEGPVLVEAIEEELQALPATPSEHHACDRMRAAWGPN